MWPTLNYKKYKFVSLKQIAQSRPYLGGGGIQTLPDIV